MRARTGDWVAEPAVESATARAVLAQDRVANVYALSDLEPPYDRYTTVALASRHGVPEAACLVVRHPAFTGIVTHGPAGGLRAILSALSLPETTHLDIPAGHRQVIDQFYVFAEPLERQLMAITPARFRAVPELPATVVCLGPADLDDLVDVYAGADFHAWP